MKTLNITQQPKNNRLAWLLAAALIPAAFASAQAGETYRQGADRRSPVAVSAVQGSIQVTHQIPGGAITVGVQIGQPRTVVIERHDQRPAREVTVIHEEPRREVRRVVIIRQENERRHEGFQRADYRRDDDGRGNHNGYVGHSGHEGRGDRGYEGDRSW